MYRLLSLSSLVLLRGLGLGLLALLQVQPPRWLGMGLRGRSGGPKLLLHLPLHLGGQ